MFIHFHAHDILIFALDCNKISLNIKLNVNSICVNECLHDPNIFRVYKY